MIKECELLEALEKNWIREAILDVFDTGSDSLHYIDVEVILFKKISMKFYSNLICAMI